MVILISKLPLWFLSFRPHPLTRSPLDNWFDVNPQVILACSLSHQQWKTTIRGTIVLIINICRYCRIPAPGTFEALTLAATMLIPIPLLRGLFRVTGTTSGSACSTYLKQTIINRRCSHMSLIPHWNKRIVCSGLTVHGADVDLGKCTVQIPFEFVWTVREQRPEERNSCSWIRKIQFLLSPTIPKSPLSPTSKLRATFVAF